MGLTYCKRLIGSRLSCILPKKAYTGGCISFFTKEKMKKREK